MSTHLRCASGRIAFSNNVNANCFKEYSGCLCHVGHHQRSRADRNHPAAIKERVSLEANIPEIITATDLIDIEGVGATFNGVSQVDAVTHGLPGGNYSYCFQLWDSDGQLLTQERTCSSLNVPETTIRLIVNAIPPYTPVLEDIYNMLMVTATSNRNVTVPVSPLRLKAIMVL